jgi:MFS family permease
VLTADDMKEYFHKMPFTSASPGSPLRSRDYRLVVGAKAVSFVGDEAAVIALTLALASHGPWAVAGLMLAGFAPMIVMAPLAGVLVDRHDSRHLLVLTGILQTAVCAVLASTSSLPLVLALVFLLGAGQAVTSATWSALLPGVVGVPNMARAVGISQAVTNASMVLAPALGGVLVALGGARLALLLDVATFLALTVAGQTISHRRRIERSTEEGDDWRLGARVLLADRILTVLIAMLFLFMLLGAMVNVVDVFLVRYTLHAGPVWYGASVAVFGVAMVAGSLASGRINGQRQLLIGAVVSMLLLSVSMLGYAAAPTILWLFPPAVVGGVGNALLNMTVNTVVATRVAEQVRGRVAAAIGGLMSAGMVGAMLLGGVLANVFTPREVFLLGSIVGAAVPLLVGPRLLKASAAPTPTPVDAHVELAA